MCMEDIRIGRKKITNVRQVTLTNGAETPVVGSATKRVHLTIVTTGGDARITPVEGTPTGNAAFPLRATLPPLDFDIETHGDLVTKRWVGSGVAADVLCLVIETLLPDE